MAGIRLIKEALDPSEIRPENTWFMRVRAESSEPGLDSDIFVYHVHSNNSGYSGDVFECVASILQMQDIESGSFSFTMSNVQDPANGDYVFSDIYEDYYNTPVYVKDGDNVTIGLSGLEGSGSIIYLQASEGGLSWVCQYKELWEDTNESPTTILYSNTLFQTAESARLPDDPLIDWVEAEPIFTNQSFKETPVDFPYYRRNVLECFFVTPEELEDAWNIILEDTKSLVISHREQQAAIIEEDIVIDPQ